MTQALERAIRNPRPVRGIGGRSPMAGLDRRSLGFADVLAQSVSAMAPSAAVTTIPVMVFAASGPATLWAVALAAAITLLVASSVNQFAKRMSAAGSLYTFVAKGLGRGASFASGVAMLIGYGFISMFALFGAGFYLRVLLGRVWPELAESPVVAAITMAVLGMLAMFVLARGIRLSARVTLLVEAVSVVVIVAFIVLVIGQLPDAVDWSVLDTSGSTLNDVAIGVVIALTAFVGFESSAALGVEAKRPFAAIPRALIWTVLGTGLLYVFGTYGQLAGFAQLGLDITVSASPVNDLADSKGVGWLGLVLDVSIATSFFACVVASTTALVRLLFTMAREGVIHRSLGATSVRRHTPIVAVLWTVPVIVVLPLILLFAGYDLRQAMDFLLVCAASGYILGYILVCAAVPVMLTRIGEVTAWPVVKAVAAAVLLVIGLVIYLATEAMGPRPGGVVLFLLLVLGAVALYPLLVRRMHPREGAIGLYDIPTAADVLGGGSAMGEPGVDRHPDPGDD